MLTTYGWYDTTPSFAKNPRGPSYTIPMAHSARVNIPAYPYNNAATTHYPYHSAGVHEPENSRRPDPYPSRAAQDPMGSSYQRYSPPRSSNMAAPRAHHEMKVEDPVRGYKISQRTAKPYVYVYEASTDAELDAFPVSPSAIPSKASIPSAENAIERERPKLRVVNLPDGVSSVSSSPASSPNPSTPPDSNPLINPTIVTRGTKAGGDVGTDMSDDDTLVQTYVSKAQIVNGNMMTEAVAYGVSVQNHHGKNVFAGIVGTTRPAEVINPRQCDELACNGRTVRWSENLICPSPVLASRRRKGWFCRRGDQLWTNDGLYVAPEPGHEYPPDLDDYPELGTGWQNEEGIRIDMHHRLIPKPPLRPALKRSGTKESSLEAKQQQQTPPFKEKGK